MKKPLLALLFVTVAAYAAADFTAELKQEVANDIQGLADDTVNEGESSAKVTYEKKVPGVECEIRNHKDPKLKWAFCSVEFRVTYAGDQENEAIRTCALAYSFNPDNVAATLERGKDENFDDCIEWLGESLD